jgi:hypothetical protein
MREAGYWVWGSGPGAAAGHLPVSLPVHELPRPPGRRKDVPVADGERPGWWHPAGDTVAIGRRGCSILARLSSDDVRR